MASTSSPQTDEPFPYPSGVNVADSFTQRLCATNYFAWKPLMLRFLESHKLSGFVDGTINPPKKPPLLSESSLWMEERRLEEQETREKKRQEDWNQQHMQQEGETQSLADWVQERERKQKRREGEWEESLEEQERWQEWLRRKEWGRECERRKKQMLGRKEEEQKEREEHRIYTGWKRSDDLVGRWILATVTEEIQLQVTHLATAREVWIELEDILTSAFQPSHLCGKEMTEPVETMASKSFPYPLGVNVANSFTLRLCATNYFTWKPLMFGFLKSHKLSGFVDGTINLPHKPPPLWESSLLLEERYKEEQETMEKKRQEDWNQQHMQQEGETQSLADWVQEREQKLREGEWEESLEEQERWQEWLRRQEWGRECKLWRERMLERKRTERKERKEHRIYRGWKRSDDLVRGWILATVREELLPQVMKLETAGEVWIKLGEILTPTFQPSHLQLYDFTDQNRGQIQRQHRVLHRAILTADWVTAAKLLDQNPPNAVLEPITWCLETALIVAVRSAKRIDFVEKLMERMSMLPTGEQYQLLEQQDISGSTALHAAVDGGNIDAAKRLVEENWQLSYIGDKHGTLPVHKAAGLGNREMVDFLLENSMYELESTHKLLHSLASSGLYDIALKVLHFNRELASKKSSPLVVMAQKRTSFLSGTSLSLLERLIYYVIPLKLEDIANQPQRSNIDSIVEPPQRSDIDSIVEPPQRSDIVEPPQRSGIESIVEPPQRSDIDSIVEPPQRSDIVEPPQRSGIESIVEPPQRSDIDSIVEPPQTSDIVEPPQRSDIDSIVEHPQTSDFDCIDEIDIIVEPPQRSDIDSIVVPPQRNNIDSIVEPVVYSSISVAVRQILKVLQVGHILFWDVAEKLVPRIKSVRETKLLHNQALNLVKWLCHYVEETGSRNVAEILTEPVRNATCMGIHEIVEEILESFPTTIHLKSEKDRSLFHLAIVYRRANVFNLIYQMEEDRRAFLSMPDASTNNALHLAGSLTPQQQLLLRASAAGAALQMQRELQWFEEVGKWMLPHAKEHMNAEGRTPQEEFTETHKDLVKEGERWMKDTANSCTIVAALITTIVFAAAITVPGGSFSDSSSDKKGLPIRLGGRAFTVFGVSNALAMFSSSASLLMFLSILTCRYGEEDFRYSLPRRLIIGLVTLFLSIISMMVAFGATLKIVFEEKTAWLLYPVAVLSSAPVALFALWQFPLLYAMIKSTYFPGIFGKKSSRILY